MTQPPCNLVCECGARHIVCVDASIDERTRITALEQSAASAGWYRVGGRHGGSWYCGDCYGSRVLEAVMLKKSGQGQAMQHVDEAADERAALLRPVLVGVVEPKARDGWRR